MPHSTVCCLSAFEIGVSESGREGGRGAPACSSDLQFLSGIEGNCIDSLCLCCFRCSYVFLHVNFFLFYYPVPQPLPETLHRLRERFLQPAAGMHLARESPATAAGGWVLFGVQGWASPDATSPEIDLGKADPFPEAIGAGDRPQEHQCEQGFPLKPVHLPEMRAPLGEMSSALGTCAGHHKPQAGWCHLEKALRYLSCQLLCTVKTGWKRSRALGLGQISQERVCSYCPCIQLLAHPGCRHRPDPPCHPSPGPSGALRCLWKKTLPIH